MSALASVALVCITGLVALLLLDLYKDSRAESTSQLWRSRWEIQMEGFSKPNLDSGEPAELVPRAVVDPLGLVRDQDFRLFQEFRSHGLLSWIRAGLQPLSPQDQPAALVRLIADVDAVYQASLGAFAKTHCQPAATFGVLFRHRYLARAGWCEPDFRFPASAPGCGHCRFTALCVAGAGFAPPRADSGLAV